MAVIESWFNQDLKKPVQVHYLDGNLFSNNGNGNRIGVVVTDDGEAVTLSGTVSGYAVLANGTTVPCTGTKSGNKASVLVPPAAYLPGNIFISVFLTDGSTVTTLAAVSTNVIQARTDSQVDPGSVVSDWTTTINAAMQSVETAAANLGHIVATPYASLTFPVPLGKYCYYNNNLYRCISPISSSEDFTADHWTSAINLGDEVGALNSALTDYGVMSKNLIGLMANTIYPVDIKQGTNICMSTADGSNNPTSGLWLRLYNSSKTEVQSTQFPTNVSSKYITTNSDISYVSWNIDPSSAVQLNVGKTPIQYKEYFENAKFIYKDVKPIIGLSETVTSSMLEQGAIYDSGSTGGSTTELRLKSPKIREVLKPVLITVTCGTGQLVAVKWWEGTPSLSTLEEKRIITSSEKIIITEGRNYAILIAKTNGETITTSDYSSIIIISDIVTDLINQNSTDIKNIMENVDPDNSWQEIAQTFAALQKTDGLIENFMFFSDPHLLTGQSGWMDNFNKYIKKLETYYKNAPVNMTLCGGDWLYNENSLNTFELCYMRKIAENALSPFYNVVGNHDMYSGDGLYSEEELRNILFPMRNKCYYKFSGANTQFYALDTGMDSAQYADMTTYRWEQIDWLAKALISDDSAYSMILMHIFSDNVDHSVLTPFAENVVSVCAAYNQRSSVTLNGEAYDFASCTGKMKLILCGHNHADWNSTNSGIPVVCIRNTQNGGPSFDLCCVNYENDEMNMLRVGGGSDRTIALAT